MGDIETANKEIIRYSQTIVFSEEIKVIQQGKLIKRSSALYGLYPKSRWGVNQISYT